MAGIVRVWVTPDMETQHMAPPPGDDVTKEWEGVTACGVNGVLRWVHGEVVDHGKACADCLAVAGPAPPLDGDHPGPV